jgi:hypothetical protein
LTPGFFILAAPLVVGLILSIRWPRVGTALLKVGDLSISLALIPLGIGLVIMPYWRYRENLFSEALVSATLPLFLCLSVWAAKPEARIF